MTTTGAGSANDRPVLGRAEGRAPAFLTDFDDTAAVQNVAELLLHRFGAENWTEVRQQFRDGKLTLKEYQEITFREIRADRAAMQHYVREQATLRPWFPELYQFCIAHGIPLAVVSQGLDFYISALLERYGFGDVPIYAVDTSFQDGRISYHYNHTYPGKESQGQFQGFRGGAVPKSGATTSSTPAMEFPTWKPPVRRTWCSPTAPWRDTATKRGFPTRLSRTTSPCC